MIRLKKQTKPAANKPAARNAGGFRKLTFTKLINDRGIEKQQQVKPALRLPATR